MKKRGLALLLLLFFTLASCNVGADAPIGQPSALPVGRGILDAPPVTVSPTPDPVASMTVEEKAGQLLVAGIKGLTPGEDGRAAIEDYHVGGIILFSRNVDTPAQLAALTNDLKALAGNGIPPFLCVDEEGGTVSRMPQALADLTAPHRYIEDGGDPYALGKTLGAECKAFGFHIDFAPVLDVWSNPQNTVIADRAFSSDWAGAAVGVDCARGLLDAGVIPVVKHFPGHGDTIADSHKTLPVVEKTMETLMEEELVPFRAAIDAGLPAVMVGHILMGQIDPDRPATLSPKVVNGLLRGELGFDGLVVTDDLVMRAITNTYGLGEAAVLAVEAGCDLLLVCHETENLVAVHAALLKAVESGRISSDRLDESVRRILKLKEEYQVTAKAVPTPNVEALNQTIRAIKP